MMAACAFLRAKTRNGMPILLITSGKIDAADYFNIF